jgi:hypothetical protein
MPAMNIGYACINTHTHNRVRTRDLPYRKILNYTQYCRYMLKLRNYASVNKP